jgi:hypothetical protein
MKTKLLLAAVITIWIAAWSVSVRAAEPVAAVSTAPGWEARLDELLAASGRETLPEAFGRGAVHAGAKLNEVRTFHVPLARFGERSDLSLTRKGIRLKIRLGR